MTYDDAHAACAKLGWELSREDQSTEFDRLIVFTARDLSFVHPEVAPEVNEDTTPNDAAPHVTDDSAGCLTDIARTQQIPGSRWNGIDAARDEGAALGRLLAKIRNG